MKYYRAENSTKPIKVNRQFVNWIRAEALFGGSLGGVYATSNPVLLTALDALVADGSSGVNEITADEYGVELPTYDGTPGSPVGVKVPSFANQLYHDTDADTYWRSTGLTSADWVAIAGGAEPTGFDWGPDDTVLASSGPSGLIDSTGITSISFYSVTSVTGALNYNGCPFESVQFPKLETVGVAANFSQSPSLSSLGFPVLTSVGTDFDLSSCPALAVLQLPLLVTVGGALSISDAITVLELPMLATVGAALFIYGPTNLVTASLPSLTTVAGDFSMNSCSALTTFSAPLWLPSNASTINFSGDALDVTSVDHILARCVASAGFVAGTVDLSGGTSSPPSSVAPGSDYDILFQRGVTVTVNP